MLRIRPYFIAIALIALSFLSVLPRASVAGEFESLLLGRTINATDGNFSVGVKLAKDNKATALLPEVAPYEGVWWARPDGRLCVTFNGLWEGGNCGFIRRVGEGYSLTLGAWTPPPYYIEKRVAVQTHFPAPTSAPAALKFKGKDLAGRVLSIRDSFSNLSLTFSEDGTLAYAAETGLAFRGHWWVQGAERLCVASRTLWRVGRCFELHGERLTGSGYLVPLTAGGTPASDAWFPASLSAGKAPATN